MSPRNGKTLAIMAAALLLTLSPLSHARPSLNFGFSYGNGSLSTDGNHFNDGSLGSSVVIDPDTTAWNVYMELNFNRYLRMEINHDESGSATMSGFSDGTGSYWWYGPVSGDYSLAAIKVGAVGLFPLDANDRFRLLGKLGLALWFATVDLKSYAQTVTDVSAGVSPYVGVGAELDLSDRVSLRVQHEMYSAASNSDSYFPSGYTLDYRSTTMGLLFKF